MTAAVTLPPIKPIETTGEAEQAIVQFAGIMNSLITIVEEETALIRAGKLRDAARLEDAKTELARQYTRESERFKRSKAFLDRSVPEAIDLLRRRHETFHALLQINLTVLATAHAVSEGIVRGVSGELARKQMPQTYGASGRANNPGPRASQPLSLSRTL